MNLKYLLTLVLCLFTFSLWSQSYSIDFSLGDRNAYGDSCWSLPRVSIRTTGPGLIDGATARTGPLNNPLSPHSIVMPSTQLYGRDSIIFEHYVQNLSGVSFRKAEVIVVNLLHPARPTTVLYDQNYTNNALQRTAVAIPDTIVGIYLIRLRFSGSGGASRVYIDNIVIPGNIVATPGSSCAIDQGLIFPVEWLSFDVKTSIRGVSLSWSTATETNNDFFAIERSIDGSFYERLGQIEGAGHSGVPRSYQYWDLKAQSLRQNRLYYRLKQVDFDGSFSYSQVIEAQFDFPTIDMQLYQASSTLRISLLFPDGGTHTLKVLDSTGRLIYRSYPKAANRNLKREISLDTHSWAKGVYFVQLSGHSGQKSLVWVVR